MCSLKIKSFSKDSFILLLQHIINDIDVKEVVFSCKTPTTPSKFYKAPAPSEARIDIALSGIKHMIYPDGDKLKDSLLHPGQIHYCPPFCWKLPVWDSSHEMSSIVFKKEYTRITYIKYKHTGLLRDPPRASIFYHTSLPINEIGLSIIKALNGMVDIADNTKVKVDLMRSLLKITLLDLENDQPYHSGKGHTTWLKVNEYLYENFYYPINRASVANTFKLNPSHLSRLFATEGTEGFNATLQRLRMQHSTTLLKNSSAAIKEIAEQCGYVSTISFAAAFKKYHGISPGRYRITKISSQSNNLKK